MLAWPAFADDKPKDDPKVEKKGQSPKEQFEALQKELNTKRQALLTELRKAKGKEQQAISKKYTELGQSYTEKAMKIAEDNPNDPVAADAVFFVLRTRGGGEPFKKASEMVAKVAAGMTAKDLAPKLAGLFINEPKLSEAVFNVAEKDPKDPAALDLYAFVMQSGGGADARKKSIEKVKAIIAEMPMDDLSRRINSMSANNAVMIGAVLDRAKKDSKDPKAPDLLAWVATRAYYMPVGIEAAATLINQHGDHPMIVRVLAVLPEGRDAQRAGALARQVMDGAKKPEVKAAATLALAQVLVQQTNNLGDKPDECEKTAAEAEKYYAAYIDQAKDAAKTNAEDELAYFRKLRVGKPAPEITAPDLDKKEFKLSDYRGKVVLLDFWGHW